MVEIRTEINEEENKEEYEVWDNDEQIYTGYFDLPSPLEREEKLMIVLANALGFEPAELLNLPIFEKYWEEDREKGGA